MPEDNKNTPPAGTPPADNNGGNNGGEDKKPVTFTQEDLDRVAAKTRDEEKKKADKLVADAAKKAREDALAEAKLTEEERQKKEQAQREKEQADRENQLTLRENTADAKEKFAELNLPARLATFFVVLDKDTMMGGIDTFKKAWDEALEAAVTARLKGKTPTDPKKDQEGGTPTPVSEIPTFI